MENEKKKLKPVVTTAEVTKQKKSFSKRLMSTFIQGTKEEITDYLIQDVLVPGAKNLMLDTIEMIFFNKTSSRGRSKRDRDGYTDYRSSYGKKRHERERRKREEEDVDYRDVVLTDREAAYEVVDQLQYRIEETGEASIADLLDLVNLPTKPSDNDYGWERKSDISVRRVSNGWLIDVPRARYLD